MRIGIASGSCSKDSFNNAKQLGCEFIEICCNSAEDAANFVNSKKETAQNIAITGVALSCVGRWNHNIQKNGKIDHELKKGYLELLDTARELGAKTFVCGFNYDDSISLFRNYCNAIEFFHDLIHRADSKIAVAVQNCDWNNFIVSPKQWEVVLGEHPELMLKFDPSHPYNRNEDYLAQLSDWGERVAHIHIKGTVHAGKRYVDDPPAGMDS